MLKELLNKTYQNFYINKENEIIGIESPKLKWKIKNPSELQAYYIVKIQKMKNNPVAVDLFKDRIIKLEKQLKQLTNAMNKRVYSKIEEV